MSLASLVAVPSTLSWHPSSTNFLALSSGVSHRRHLVQAHIRGKLPRVGCNAQRVSLGSSFLVGSGLDRVWRDGSSEEGVGHGGVKGKKGSRIGRNVVEARASRLPEAVVGVMEVVKAGWTANPPTWESSFISVGSILVVGAPAFVVGLTKSGIAVSYLLASVIWRAYGGPGLLTITLFYAILGV